MAQLNLINLLIGILLVVGIPKIYGAKEVREVEENLRSASFKSRDAAIRDSLVSISSGKLAASDDRLVALIAENIKEAALRANNPSIGIEAAAREAQEAVSEITAAYTALIFRSTSAKEAQRLFRRFQNTVDKIVDYAKSGNFIVTHQPPRSNV